jgi:hypothetical protein
MSAALGNDGLEGFEVRYVFVDDGLVDGLPKVLCGLKLGGVGRKEDQPDSLGDRQVAFAVPTGVVERENDDPIPASPGFLGEGRQQGLEERLRDAAGNVPEAFSGSRGNERRDVEPLEAMMAGRDRAHADGRPHPSQYWLQSEAMFVGRERFDGDAWMRLGFFGDDLGDFF